MMDDDNNRGKLIRRWICRDEDMMRARDLALVPPELERAVSTGGVTSML